MEILINFIAVLVIVIEVVYLFTCGSVVLKRRYSKNEYYFAKAIYLMLAIVVFADAMLSDSVSIYEASLSVFIALLILKDCLKVRDILNRVK